jgi:PIN domain nuclease of toxin-antitoxin system
LTLQQDPADLVLAATTQGLDMSVVTADTRVLRLGIIKTLASR